MANLTISNVLGGLKNPAIVAAGFIGGMVVQKLVNKLLNSETVVNGLGADAVLTLKDYATPLVTSVLGVGTSILVESDTMKKLATGVAISGMTSIGMNILWGKNLLAGTCDGILGSIMGEDPDLDGYDEYIEGVDDDLDSLESGTTGALDIPFNPPALRDTNYERETISGYAGYGTIA